MLQDRRVHWYVGANAINVKTPLFNDVPEIASWGIHAWRSAPLNAVQTESYGAFVHLLQTALDGARNIAQIQIERGFNHAKQHHSKPAKRDPFHQPGFMERSIPKDARRRNWRGSVA